MHSSRWTQTARVFMAAAVVSFLSPTLLHADVKEGDTVTKANMDQAGDLLIPGIKWFVEHGMPIKVGPYKKVELPKLFKEALHHALTALQRARLGDQRPGLRRKCNAEASEARQSGALRDQSDASAQRSVGLERFNRRAAARDEDMSLANICSQWHRRGRPESGDRSFIQNGDFSGTDADERQVCRIDQCRVVVALVAMKQNDAGRFIFLGPDVGRNLVF